jgi:uncharacterized membrane protein YdjX (TVP38/TMEM64 family)
VADLTARKRGLLKVAALLAMIAAGLVALRFTPLGAFISREGIGRGIEVLRASSWAPLLFVPLYAAAVALAVPGTILTLAGGAVFGLWWGTAFNWLGATVGANLAYALARYLGRDGISQLLGEKTQSWPGLERLNEAVESHGFQGMLTLRLIPVVPFNALNFGGGLLGMPWPAYAISTAIGILPGTFVYTMFADALLQGSTAASRDAFVRVVASGTLLVLLSFLPRILTRMKVRLPGAGATLLAFAALPFGAEQVPAQTVPDHSTFDRLLQEVALRPAVDYAQLKEGPGIPVPLRVGGSQRIPTGRRDPSGILLLRLDPERHRPLGVRRGPGGLPEEEALCQIDTLH